MRLSLPVLTVASLLLLGACDTMTEADASSAAIASQTDAEAKSSTCSAPSLSHNYPSSSNQAYVFTVTPGAGNVAGSIEEKLSFGSVYNPKKGASFSNGAYTYTTDWGPPDGRPLYSASYRARAMCSNGEISPYSSPVTVNIAL